jgi:hypothetical protein
MFGIPRSVLLIAFFLHPLIAKVTLQIDGPHCTEPGAFNMHRGPLNIPGLRHDCYAALNIMPNTGVDGDAQDMTRNSHRRGSQDPFSVRLTGQGTYRINNDTIRFPAIFTSGDCAVFVQPGGQYASYQKTALFHHVYTWPTLRNLAKRAIDACLGVEPRLEIFQGFTWLHLGYVDGRYDTLTLGTGIWVKWRGEEANTPQFTEMDKVRFSAYNVYTSTGKLHDVHWEVPWQRPL